MDSDWLSGYAKIHEGIVSGSFPAYRRRFAVWTCTELVVPVSPESTPRCAGLANRLLGILTAFLYAIVTERALIIDWPGDDASHIRKFLHSPHFRWNATKSTWSHLDSISLDTRLGPARSGWHSVRRELKTFHWLNDHRASVVKLTLLEGYFEDLLQNPNLAAACFHGLNLKTSDDVVGQLGKILFHPHKSLENFLAKSFRGTFRLGVQIRIGTFEGGEMGIGLPELERFRIKLLAVLVKLARHHSSLSIVIACDSPEAIAIARSWDLNVSDRKIEVSSSTYGIGSIDFAQSQEVMEKSLFDFWSLATCDEVMISVPSTFGLVARSLNLTGSVEHFAFVRSDWEAALKNHYGASFAADEHIDFKRTFGRAFCSTVGWAGDLCLQ
mmetsp:Transcript_30067/g.68044  ORF Transcript_30067/g.68044 Transcript_30067/m.68044 type:complete len:384 (-) Transcript_30067:429-1580(-)